MRGSKAMKTFRKTGSNRCDFPEHGRIQPDLPLADRAALECPPALEDTPIPQNDPPSEVTKNVEARGLAPPVWSCHPQSVENLPQKNPKSRGPPHAPIPAIIPSGARTALERLAQEDVFARRNEITLPIIDPRTVTSQPDPLAWSSHAKGNEHLPQMEDIPGLPNTHIPPILPFPSGRGEFEGPVQEDHFTPGQDFEFPRIKPRSMASGSRRPAWGRHVFFPIAAVTLTFLLCVIYLRAPIATNVTQSRDQREIERLDTTANIPRAPSVRDQDTSSDTGGQTAKRNAVQGTTASREPKNERPPNGLVNERGEQQTSLQGGEIRSGSPATAAQSQEPDHEKNATPLQDRVATLSQDLATARLENEVQNQKALAAERDRTAALKSLELERERARALAKELAKTRGRVEATAPEVARQLKPAPEAAKSELQQSGPVMFPRHATHRIHTSLGWSIYRGKERRGGRRPTREYSCKMRDLPPKGLVADLRAPMDEVSLRHTPSVNRDKLRRLTCGTT